MGCVLHGLQDKRIYHVLSITITTDFTCSLTYTIVPNYIDFYIEDHINNNGQELPILLAHRQFYSPVDKLTTVSARLRLYML